MFIDLNEIIANRYDIDGRQKVGCRVLYYHGQYAHLPPTGAKLNAECVVEGLKDLKDCPLVEILVGRA